MPTPKTILIIDDDDDLREALAEQLALHEAFRPVQASTAAEGVRMGREVRADLILFSLALLALSAASAVCGIVPEREAHPSLYDGYEVLLETLQDEHVWPAIFVRFELGLLQELGFGLDLTRCAATGARDDLVYVSPKSGSAVSRAAGEPYKERLFRLPGFLVGTQAGEASPADVAEGLRLTGHFLERHLFAAHERHLPDARIRLMEKIAARAG